MIMICFIQVGIVKGSSLRLTPPYILVADVWQSKNINAINFWSENVHLFGIMHLRALGK